MTPRSPKYVISIVPALLVWALAVVPTLATSQEPDPASADAPAQEEAAVPAGDPKEAETIDPEEAAAEARRKELEEQKTAIIAHYDETIAETEKVIAEMEKTKGDERRLLEKQIIELKLEILATFGRGIEILQKHEEAGIDAGELRKVLVAEGKVLGPAIVRHIDASEKRLAELRLEREEVPLAELLNAEQAIEREAVWTGQLYRAYRDAITWKQKLGLDSSRERDDLEARLVEQADRESRRIDIVNERIDELLEQVAESTENPDDKIRLAALNARKQTSVAHLTNLATAMGNLGMDATEYQKSLALNKGEVTVEMLQPRVALGLLEQGVIYTADLIRTAGPGIALKLIVFVLIVAAARLLGRLTRRLMRRAFAASQGQKSQLLQNMIINLTGDAVMAIGVLIGLSNLGIAIGPLLTGLGIAGFIVGFALQDSLSNFAAGMLILSYRPYDVGDMIDGGGVFGQVSDMNLVSTTILTIDNQTLIVPNGKIWGNVIKNVTNQARRRVDMKYSVAYDTDLDHAERVLMQVLTSHDKILSDPEPMVKLHELQDDGMMFVVRPWVKTQDYWEVYWDVTREVKCAFDREGISIPFPQRQLHVESEATHSST